MSSIEMILDYAKNGNELAVFIVVLIIIGAIQQIIVGCFKWTVIGIRGYQGVEKITSYITAADIEDEEELEDMDEEDLIKIIRQLKASNINLQAQVDTLKSVTNAKK